MKPNTQKILINVIGCLAFLSIPILTSPDFNEGWKLIHIRPFQGYFLRYSLLILLFYVNYYYLIPKLFLKNNKIPFFIVSCIGFLLFIYFPNRIIPNEVFRQVPGFDHHPPERIGQSIVFFDTQILISYLLMLSFALLIKMNRNLSKIKTEKLNAEVSYLKAQINPHFLFNTLNSLYALTLEKSNEAPNAVLKLSNMMRYVVTESAVDFVSLEKEINHINDYIALQKLRIDKETNLVVTFEGNPSGKMIAPLILIPFIENAFKYGINPDKNSFIEIDIKIERNDFILKIKNSIVNVSIPEELKSEKGLDNTTKRLAYMYPNKHTLSISEANAVFEVNLKINLE